MFIFSGRWKKKKKQREKKDTTRDRRDRSVIKARRRKVDKLRTMNLYRVLLRRYERDKFAKAQRREIEATK